MKLSRYFLFLFLAVGLIAPTARGAYFPWLPSCASVIARFMSLKKDYFRDEFLYREHVIDGEPWHEVLVVEEFPGTQGFTTRVVKREVRKGKAKTLAEGGELQSVDYDTLRQWHLDFANSVVDLTIDKYIKRRNWGTDFRAKLKGMAEEYLNDSIYVSILETGTGNVVGGKRYILAPYGIRKGAVVPEGHLVNKYYGPVTSFREAGKEIDPSDRSLPLPPRTLPEADYLDIDLPRTGIRPPGDKTGVKTGMQVEVGALVVEETLDREPRGKVWAELHLQDLRLAFEEENDALAYGGITFHAYADPVSRRMYLNDLNWGWELLNGYGKDGKTVGFEKDQEAPVIEKEGTDWVPIIFHPERMEDYHLRLVNGEIPRGKDTDVGERQREIGASLGGAEGVETIDALLLGLTSGHQDIVAASAVGLIRLAHRYDLAMKKKEKARINPAFAWTVPKRTADKTDLPDRIEQSLDGYFKSATHRDEKIIGLAIVGHMLELRIDQGPLNLKHLRDKYLLPYLGDPDLLVRATALAHLQAQFTPIQMADAIKDLPLNSRVRARAAAEFRRGRLHNLLISEVQKIGSRLARGRGQMEVAFDPGATLQWMAGVSDHLDGAARHSPDSISEKIWLDLTAGRLEDAADDWRAKLENAIRADFNSQRSAVRIQAARNLRASMETGIALPTLDRKRALRNILVPLVNDKSPIVSRFTLSLIQDLYLRSDLQKALFGQRKHDKIRERADQIVRESGMLPTHKSLMVGRLKSVWEHSEALNQENIGAVAETLNQYAIGNPKLAEALIELSLLDD